MVPKACCSSMIGTVLVVCVYLVNDEPEHSPPRSVSQYSTQQSTIVCLSRKGNVVS